VTGRRGQLGAATAVDGPNAAGVGTDSAGDGAGKAPRRRRPPELTLLRPLPGTTPIHRLWAGTKLVLVAVVALALGLQPEWATIGAVAGVVVVAAAVARVPRGALPRLPRWFFIGFGLAAFLSLRATAPPIGHLAGIPISWGGLADWARFTALAVTMFAAAAVVSWTTPLAEVAPALARLGTPLRWVRVPVDEWAATIALSIRCLPLLIDEVRTVAAARRLRPVARVEDEARRNWLAREFNELLFTTLTVSLRRASELGEAMEARGGFGPVSGAPGHPSWRDAVALIVVAGALAAVLLR